MADPIEFYFDFSSPYGYFAAMRIEALAARQQRKTLWRPILLGAVFKLTGQQPLTTIPLKGDYARRDLARTARLWALPFRLPDPFPVATVAPCRAFYWLNDRDPEAAPALALALYQAYFVANRDISDPAVTVAVAAELGHDPVLVGQALNAAEIKARLKEANDAALARGVFGSPYIIADGEPFWGADRLDQVEQWLARGPW